MSPYPKKFYLSSVDIEDASNQTLQRKQVVNPKYLPVTYSLYKDLCTECVCVCAHACTQMCTHAYTNRMLNPYNSPCCKVWRTDR